MVIGEKVDQKETPSHHYISLLSPVAAIFREKTLNEPLEQNGMTTLTKRGDYFLMIQPDVESLIEVQGRQ